MLHFDATAYCFLFCFVHGTTTYLHGRSTRTANFVCFHLKARLNCQSCLEIFVYFFSMNFVVLYNALMGTRRRNISFPLPLLFFKLSFRLKIQTSCLKVITLRSADFEFWDVLILWFYRIVIIPWFCARSYAGVANWACLLEINRFSYKN